MKYIYLMTFLFCSSPLWGQELNIEFGDIISPKNESDVELYKELRHFKAEYGDWLPYRVNVLHKNDENLFVWFSLKHYKLEDKQNNALLVFDNDLNFKKMISLNDLMDAKNYSFKEIVYFSGQFLIYASTQDRKKHDEYSGLFEMTLDPKSFELTQPKLVLDIPYSNLDHIFKVNISENKKYMSVCAEMGAYKKKCCYSYFVYNENFEKVHELNGAVQKAENNLSYLDAYLSNNGEVFFLFGLTKENLNIYTHDVDGNFNNAFYEFEDQEILHTKIIEGEESCLLYCSLINESTWEDYTINLYPIGEHEPFISIAVEGEWYEPFFEYWSDVSELPNNKFFGSHFIAPIELTKVIRTENTVNYILVKNKPRATGSIYDAASKRTYDNKFAQDYTDTRGDIFFIQYDKKGVFLKKQKIERESLLKVHNHEIYIQEDNKLFVLFTDIYVEPGTVLKKEDRTPKIRNYTHEKSQLYWCVVNLDTYEMTSPKAVEFIVGSANSQYEIWLKNALVHENEFYTIGVADELNERVFKAEIEF